MKTFETVPKGGHYRTKCCHVEWFIRANSKLPVCPRCQQETTWGLILTSDVPPPRQPERGFRTG